ncbi:MAG: fibronectin type III domain-containing protein, partial [Desulfosporosinus sp.]
DLNSYEITYTKSSITIWTTVVIPAGTTCATIEDLLKGSSYRFRIQAKDAVGNYSAYSSTIWVTAKDLTPPAAPVGLTAEVADRAIALTWTANTETDLAGYRLEYKLSTSSIWSIASSILNVTAISYNKTSLTNGKTYEFRLKAKDNSGNWSVYSEIVSGVPGK